MSRVSPILFNTEMVRAILEGRKTVTRRLIKAPVLSKVEPPKKVTLKNGVANFEWNTPKTAGGFEIKMPYRQGDILYVKEPWHVYQKRVGKGETCRIAEFFGYKASIQNSEDADTPWKSPACMPNEAARIWLRVKNVRVERLQEITEEQALSEGVPDDSDYPISKVYCPRCRGEGLIGAVGASLGYMEVDCPDCDTAIKRFKNLWNSTIKKSDLDRYGWGANPYVFVIEFERCDKPERWCV